MYWDYRITGICFVWVFLFVLVYTFASFLIENRLITSMKDKKIGKQMINIACS